MVKSRLVSIIIPTFNEANYIGTCLKSLKSQTYKNFEIIVIDDGSTDKTREIVKKVRGVRLILGEHRGPGFSRNLGAREAKGEILCFVDADMTFDKDYLKNLTSPIIKDKTGKIIGTTHDYEIAINTDNWVSNLWGKIRVNKETADNIKIFRAIRKNKFLEFGGFDPKYGYADDQTFWFKYKIKPFVAEKTVCYHRNPETLKETYKQARWIGSSWKEKYWFFSLPVLNNLLSLGFFGIIPFLSFVKAVKSSNKSRFLHSIEFYTYKSGGYGAGIVRAVWLRRFEK